LDDLIAFAPEQLVERHALPGKSLLAVLHAIQDELGYVPPATVPSLARVMNLSRAEVHGVVTFYHDFRREPCAPHLLQLCRAEACQSMGSEDLAAARLAIADRGGDLTSACEHYRSAERIYAGELLSSEAVEPALAPRVAEYAALFETTLARLVEIRVEEAGLLPAPPSPFTLRFDTGVPAVVTARGAK